MSRAIDFSSASRICGLVIQPERWGCPHDAASGWEADGWMLPHEASISGEATARSGKRSRVAEQGPRRAFEVMVFLLSTDCRAGSRRRKRPYAQLSVPSRTARTPGRTCSAEGMDEKSASISARVDRR